MKKILLIVFTILSISAFSQSYKIRSEGSIEQPELENISGNNIDLSSFSNPTSSSASPLYDGGDLNAPQPGDEMVSDEAKQSNEGEAKKLLDIVLSVYPNPASDFLVVKLEQNIKTTINIMNLVGQVVQTVEVEALVNYLDVSELHGGIYFISIEYADQKVVKKIKIID